MLGADLCLLLHGKPDQCLASTGHGSVLVERADGRELESALTWQPFILGLEPRAVSSATCAEVGVGLKPSSALQGLMQVELKTCCQNSSQDVQLLD